MTRKKDLPENYWNMIDRESRPGVRSRSRSTSRSRSSSDPDPTFILTSGRGSSTVTEKLKNNNPYDLTMEKDGTEVTGVLRGRPKVVQLSFVGERDGMNYYKVSHPSRTGKN